MIKNWRIEFLLYICCTYTRTLNRNWKVVSYTPKQVEFVEVLWTLEIEESSVDELVSLTCSSTASNHQSFCPGCSRRKATFRQSRFVTLQWFSDFGWFWHFYCCNFLQFKIKTRKTFILSLWYSGTYSWKMLQASRIPIGL